METRTDKEIYAEYERRHSFWSEQSLNQIGYSTNLFFTLNLGFLAYVISQRKDFPRLSFNHQPIIEWKLVFYFTILILLFLGLIIASSIIISRLYDLRLTRFIVWVRKRVYTQHHILLADQYLDLKKNSTTNFLRTLFCKINFITKDDFENIDLLKTKFNNLREQQKLLGQFTWKIHKLHILLILIISLVYSISTFYGW